MKKILQSLWMLMACAAFAVMAACVKLSYAAGASLASIIFARGLPSVIMLLLWYARQPNQTLRTRYPWLHISRSLFGVLAMSSGFYAYSVLPLETAASLNYTTALFIALWVVVTSSFKQVKIQALAVLLGFIGVIVVLRPSVGSHQWLGVALGFLSGILGTGALLSVRRLGQCNEPIFRIVLFFSISVSTVGLISMIVMDSFWSDLHQWYWLLGIGVFGFFGQIGLTHSFGYGSTVLTAALQYTTIIFSAILGWVVWGQAPDMLAWVGIFMIIGAGALCAYGAVREHPQAKAVRK